MPEDDAVIKNILKRLKDLEKSVSELQDAVFECEQEEEEGEADD